MFDWSCVINSEGTKFLVSRPSSSQTFESIELLRLTDSDDDSEVFDDLSEDFFWLDQEVKVWLKEFDSSIFCSFSS